MRRLGVLGWPVAHSRSPAMHNAALRAFGMEDWHYQKLPVPAEMFTETVRALGQAGFVGANVTIPHKQAALALADRSSDAARSIGAANTLTFAADGTISAENTDAPGLIAALGRLDGLPAHPSALILGAGGSARAAVWALREAGAREVSIWNRTPERAAELAGELGARTVDWPERADLLINCTSVGLERSASEPEGLNQLGLTFDQVGEYSYVVDMVYRSGVTQLLAAAREHGARTLDGLEILVAQGAISFELWTGRGAPREVMRDAARQPDGDGDGGSA
jgi:shikimate dehydrogenase